MDDHDWLAERFEANRAHLRAVAYRMLGSHSEELRSRTRIELWYDSGCPNAPHVRQCPLYSQLDATDDARAAHGAR